MKKYEEIVSYFILGLLETMHINIKTLTTRFIFEKRKQLAKGTGRVLKALS